MQLTIQRWLTGFTLAVIVYGLADVAGLKACLINSILEIVK